MRCLAPFVPFLTERIYQLLKPPLINLSELDVQQGVILRVLDISHRDASCRTILCQTTSVEKDLFECLYLWEYAVGKYPGWEVPAEPTPQSLHLDHHFIEGVVVRELLRINLCKSKPAALEEWSSLCRQKHEAFHLTWGYDIDPVAWVCRRRLLISWGLRVSSWSVVSRW